jgi:hypothetical protein
MKSNLIFLGIVFALSALVSGCSKPTGSENLGPGMKTQRAFAEENLAGPKLEDGRLTFRPSNYEMTEILRVTNELERGMRQEDVLRVLGATARLDTPLLEELGGGTSRRSHRIRGALDGRVDFVVYPEEPLSELGKKVYAESNQTLGTANFQWVAKPGAKPDLIAGLEERVIQVFGRPAAREREENFSVFALSTETVGESGVSAKGTVLEYAESKRFQTMRVEIGVTPAENGSTVLLQISVEYGGWPLLQVP